MILLFLTLKNRAAGPNSLDAFFCLYEDANNRRKRLFLLGFFPICLLFIFSFFPILAYFAKYDVKRVCISSELRDSPQVRLPCVGPGFSGVPLIWSLRNDSYVPVRAFGLLRVFQILLLSLCVMVEDLGHDDAVMTTALFESPRW